MGGTLQSQVAHCPYLMVGDSMPAPLVKVMRAACL